MPFLIADDNELVRRALTCVLVRYGDCRAVHSASDAREEIARGDGIKWHGFVLDVGLGDGSGLDVLESARRMHADTPALIMSGRLDRAVVNRAAILNARFVCKPCGTSELAPFVADVIHRTTGDRIYAATERARHRWALSPREVEIVDATLRGRHRDDYLRTSGMSANTFKTHVRKLLEKADYENLASLAIDLLGQSN